MVNPFFMEEKYDQDILLSFVPEVNKSNFLGFKNIWTSDSNSNIIVSYMVNNKSQIHIENGEWKRFDIVDLVIDIIEYESRLKQKLREEKINKIFNA